MPDLPTAAWGIARAQRGPAGNNLGRAGDGSAGGYSPDRNNRAMRIFYWVMGTLIVGTLVPSALFMLLYAVTGNDVLARRASGLWGFARVFALFGFNILVWGHVAAGLWGIWFH
jgi:hypothetical protein